VRALRLVRVRREHDRRLAPILLLFIALVLGLFAGASLLAVTAAAVLGGGFLRSRGLTVSRSFARLVVIAAVICQFAFVLFALKQNAPFLLDRPRLHPNTYLAAIVVAANAALNLSVAALIVRKLPGKVNPPPLP
jgi:hypothetical protein